MIFALILNIFCDQGALQIRFPIFFEIEQYLPNLFCSWLDSIPIDTRSFYLYHLF